MMPTTQERYDIERKREVTNLPLLKLLKTQIETSYNVEAGKAQILLALHQAAVTEDWGTYERLLQTKLTHTEGVNDALAVDVDVEEEEGASLFFKETFFSFIFQRNVLVVSLPPNPNPNPHHHSYPNPTPNLTLTDSRSNCCNHGYTFVWLG